jgi:hypothetical protein
MGKIMTEKENNDSVCGAGIIAGIVMGILCIVAMAIGASERREKLKNDPEITVVEEIENCTVKYVEHGDRRKNYYLTKCGKITTSSDKPLTRAKQEPIKDISETVTKQAMSSSIDILLDN